MTIRNTTNAIEPKSITILGHFVKTGKVGGAEQLLYNLIEGLVCNQWQINLIIGTKNDLEGDFLIRFKSNDRLKIYIAGTQKSRFIAEQWALLSDIPKTDAIIFPNYYIPIFVPKKYGTKIVVIYDLQYKYFPQYFSRLKRIWLSLSHFVSLLKADKVVTLSSNARDDILKWYGNQHQLKVQVIHAPISWRKFEATNLERVPTGPKRILTVSAHYPHKNLTTLIMAFNLIKSEEPLLELVFVGNLRVNLVSANVGSQADNIHLLLKQNICENRVKILGYVSDAEMALQLRGADLFAFPSLFEGFGMPPVEALGMGVCTITTKCASLPEATLNQAIYVDDPIDPNEWAEKIKMVLSSPEKFKPSAKLIEEIRKKYDPTIIANEYIKLVASG